MIALLRRALPRFEMRVDIRQYEVYALFSVFFAGAIETHELDVVGSRFVLCPRDIAFDLEVDVTLDEGSGSAATRAEVDECIGLERRAEEGAQFCCEERCTGRGLNDRDFEFPEVGEGCLDSFTKERWEPENV